MRIKAHRQLQGFTQPDLAKKMGVSVPAVCNWENGKAYPSADKLPKLAAALACTIDDLYEDIPAAKSSQAAS